MRTASVAGVVVALGFAALAAPAAFANGIVVSGGEDRALSGAPVVLAENAVVARLHDRVAEVEVRQTFRNRSDARLEGVYLFPLPEGAVVRRFAMTMGGRLVEGEVLSAERARQVYESIVRRRQDPGLLEYAGRGLYRASVFPIEPRGEVRVALSFEQVLPEDAGTLEFRYPLATDRLNGEPVERVSVDVSAESDAELTSVYSPSHPVVVARRGERVATAAWRRERSNVDRDFVLYLGRSRDAVGFALVSHKPASEEGTFLAVISPKAVPTAEPIPKDVVFVLDTSGSMQGEKIVQARRAVVRGIQSLRPGDRFGLVAFGTDVFPFRDGLVWVDPVTRSAAHAWLDERPATGGTDIAGALRTALRTDSGGRLLLVVLVTDGRPTVGQVDPDAILAATLGANRSMARVFTFGIGSDLDVVLLDRIAEGTGGTRDYVTTGEDLEIATGRFYARVDRPALSDVTVDLGPGVHDVYPRKIPDVFAGGQVVLFGRYREGGPRKIRLSGTAAGKPVVLEFDGTLRGDAGPAFLPRLWAQRKVAYLVDEMRLHGTNPEVFQEVIRLGTRFGIVTPYTAGLVVEDAELLPPVAVLGGGFRGPGTVPPGLVPPSDTTRATEPTPPPPTTAGPPPPTTIPWPTTTPTPPSASAIDESLRLRRAKEAATAMDDDVAAGRVRTIGDKTFVRRSQRWVDTSWDGKTEPRKIEAWSDAYSALLALGDSVARILSLGDRLIFVWDGTVYEVVPAPARTGR